MIDLRHGDCRSVLRDLPDASVHCCVTDPPYGLEFMGKAWDAPWKYGMHAYGMTDTKGRRAGPSFTSSRNPMCKLCHKHKRGSRNHIACSCSSPQLDDVDHRLSDLGLFQAWCEEWAREVLRVLKPGGHLVAFGGTRTSHRMACAIEDAGFEIRDTLCWLYGSGFPKSHDVSKAIDRAAGAVREVVGVNEDYLRRKPNGMKTDGANCYGYSSADYPTDARITAPATPEAAGWTGWGTALKPAYEPIILARKPLAGTVAANVLAHGTGALNVDACRVAIVAGDYASGGINQNNGVGWGNGSLQPVRSEQHPVGRWPANVLHDGSDEVEAAFAVFGTTTSTGGKGEASQRTALGGHVYGDYSHEALGQNAGGLGDTGSASRFFYSAKAAAADRADSRHPTVKPIALMRWLVRLVTPSGGTVLDPFAGSGTTGEAAMLEGFDAVLIEQDAQHVADIRHRMDRWSGHDAPLFAEPSPPPAEDPEEARIRDLFAEPLAAD